MHGEYKSVSQCGVYKGRREAAAVLESVKDRQNVSPAVVIGASIQEPVKPDNDVVTSEIYVSSEKCQEDVSSQGMVLDAEKKAPALQYIAKQQASVYDMREGEEIKLTDNSLKSDRYAGLPRRR
jgi:hypothetical protein